MMERRLRRLEAAGRQGMDHELLRRLATLVAAEQGLDAAAVLADAEAILIRHAGRSMVDLAADFAAAHGRDLAAILADAEATLARLSARRPE